MMSGQMPTFFSDTGSNALLTACRREFLQEGRAGVTDAHRTYKDKMKPLVESILEFEDIELVDIECLRMKSRWLVRIYIDKEGGVTLDDCGEVSKQVGDVLDVHDLPPGPYTLEVSSPGLDRPLANDRDFIKYRGRKVHVRVAEKLEGMKNFRGRLVDYLDREGEKIVVVDVLGKTYHIPQTSIIKAHLEYESDQ